MPLFSHVNPFPNARPGDLAVTFRPYKPGDLPITYAAIKTETGFEELLGSAAELSTGLLLAIRAARCEDRDVIFRPMDQRKDEVEHYRQCGCIFRRNSDPNSNFLTVSPSGDGALWVCNEGDRSLRFQTPDGTLYRVAAGHTEELVPSNARANTGRLQVLLDLGGNPLDLRVSAVHVKYGDSPWQRGGLDCCTGASVDSYFCRIFCGDDCLGVLESYSDYFLKQPALKFLDINGYGPSQWYVRNKGAEPLPLIWPDGSTAQAPADGSVYPLEALAAPETEG